MESNKELVCIECNIQLNEDELNPMDSNEDEYKYCERCTSIFDMGDCYISIVEEKTECSFCKNTKTLFETDCYVGTPHNDPICNDCYFSRCRVCEINRELLIPVSRPYDLKCGDCWQNENIYNGECSLCGDFDYLFFNETLFDRDDEETMFYCKVCFDDTVMNQENLSENVQRDVEHNIVSKCDCCEIDTNDNCLFLINEIYQKRIEKIKRREIKINESLNIDDEIKEDKRINIFNENFNKVIGNLSGLISSFELGDINEIKGKPKVSKIHKVTHETKRSTDLPDRYTLDEYEIFYENAGYDYGFKTHNICSDCFLLGFILCLTESGRFPFLRRDIGWFYRGKDKEYVKKIFYQNFDLVDKIVLFDNYNINFYSPLSLVKDGDNIRFKYISSDHDLRSHRSRYLIDNSNSYSIDVSKIQ